AQTGGRERSALPDLHQIPAARNLSGAGKKAGLKGEVLGWCVPQKEESSFTRPPFPGGIRDASPRARTSFRRDDRQAGGAWGGGWERCPGWFRASQDLTKVG